MSEGIMATSVAGEEIKWHRKSRRKANREEERSVGLGE
jgi:hypothetical protein